jgi:hypothetical protein
VIFCSQAMTSALWKKTEFRIGSVCWVTKWLFSQAGITDSHTLNECCLDLWFGWLLSDFVTFLPGCEKLILFSDPAMSFSDRSVPQTSWCPPAWTPRQWSEWVGIPISNPKAASSKLCLSSSGIFLQFILWVMKANVSWPTYRQQMLVDRLIDSKC